MENLANELGISSDLMWLIFILVFGFYTFMIAMFLELCTNIKAIRNMLDNKFNPKSNNIVNTICKQNPSKFDVKEFKDKVNKYKKDNKGNIDPNYIEDLVNEYNDRFTEDFHQYLED